MNRLNNVGRITAIAMVAGLVLLAAISLAEKYQPPAPKQTCEEMLKDAARTRGPAGEYGDLLWERCQLGGNRPHGESGIEPARNGKM